MFCLPINKFHMLENFFTSFKPEGHLWKIILSIGGIPCVLCKVNMKALGIFSVAVVHCAVEFNMHKVVVKEVKFWDVEVFMYAQVNEDVFIFMESFQRIMK
jgi:hypothetical protein